MGVIFLYFSLICVRKMFNSELKRTVQDFAALAEAERLSSFNDTDPSLLSG